MSSTVAQVFVEIGADTAKLEEGLRRTRESLKETQRGAQTFGEYFRQSLNFDGPEADLSNLRGSMDSWINTLRAATPANKTYAMAMAEITQAYKTGAMSAEEAGEALEKLRNHMVQAEAAAHRSGGVFGGLKDKFSAINQGISGVVEGLTGMSLATIAGAGGVALLIRGMDQTITAASNMSETVNKVSVVFGDASDQVLAFGDSAAAGLGMSKQAALEAAGTFGNLFTSMGMGKDTSAEMSTSLVKLAGDLASFNNIDPGIALEKLRAGLVGETEPLRTLGVNLTEAAVQTKALSMGLAETAGELTAADKAQARYALILEQTANAQGDFARTSEGLANQQRILKAQQEDLAANTGEVLLPAYVKVVSTLNRAAAAFGVLVKMNGEVSEALNEHEKDVRSTTTSYDDYIAETARSFAASGKLVQVTEDGVRVLERQGLFMADVTEKYGVLSESQYNAAISADAVKSSLDGLTSTNYSIADTSNYAASASDDLTESLRGVHSAVADTGLYAQVAADAYAGLTAATDDLTAAQKNFAKSTGNDAANALKEAGLKGEKYKEALGLVDAALGTGLQTQQEYQDQLAAAAKAYADGTLSGEAYKAKLLEIRDTYEPFNEAIIKANEQIDKFKEKLDSIPRTVITVIRVIDESSDQAYTQQPGSGPGGRHGGEAYATGGEFVVPPGYPNDTYPIRVSSGERVIVQTPAEQAVSGGSGGSVNLTFGNIIINAQNGAAAGKQFMAYVGQSVAAAKRSGAQYIGA